VAARFLSSSTVSAHKAKKWSKTADRPLLRGLVRKNVTIQPTHPGHCAEETRASGSAAKWNKAREPSQDGKRGQIRLDEHAFAVSDDWRMSAESRPPDAAAGDTHDAAPTEAGAVPGTSLPSDHACSFQRVGPGKPGSQLPVGDG
jgi:hypothetical protein